MRGGSRRLTAKTPSAQYMGKAGKSGSHGGLELIDFELQDYLSQASRTPAQIRLFQFLHFSATENVLALIILLNLLVIVLETDNINILREDTSILLDYVNNGFLMIYTLELCVRIFIYQKDFLKDRWHIMDLIIVTADYVMLGLSLFVAATPSLSFLRIFRLFRLARSVKVMMAFPKLSLMIKGLFHACEVILWGCCLLSLTLVLFSIFAVQMINPVNQRIKDAGHYEGCDRCSRAFESVPQSMLTFWQQIVTGDSWGQVSVPIIEEEPWSAIFFAVVFAVVNLMVLNIVLAVVVDSSQQASLEDAADRAKEQQKLYVHHAKQLSHLCHDMDRDRSGELSKQELLNAFKSHPRFQELMYLMQINIKDCEAVFCMLDADGSGEIDYEEFIVELTKMRTNDQSTVLMFLKYYVTDIRDMLTELQETATAAAAAGGAGVQAPSPPSLAALLKAKDRIAPASLVPAPFSTTERRVEEAPPNVPPPAPPPWKQPEAAPEAAPEPQEKLSPEEIAARLAIDVDGEIRETLRDVQRTINEDIWRMIQDLSKKADAQSLLLNSIDLQAASLWRVDPPPSALNEGGVVGGGGGYESVLPLPEIVPPALVPASPEVEAQASAAPMRSPNNSNASATSSGTRRRSPRPPPPVPLCGPPERLCADVEMIGPNFGSAAPSSRNSPRNSSSLLTVPPTELPSSGRGRG